MFKRDYSRLQDCLARMDVMPLGSGALAGTTYETDRRFLADQLGFAEVCENGMDGVSDRDFPLEFLSEASVCMMHLSRLCEEIILFSTNEYGTLRLSDAYSTGSSIYAAEEKSRYGGAHPWENGQSIRRSDDPADSYERAAARL